MNSLVSIKSYGFEWHTEYGLSERQAAQRMREQGIDWAIISRFMRFGTELSLAYTSPVVLKRPPHLHRD